MKKILIVVGTRPNFIKVTQFKRIADEYSNINVEIVHTGQHFDANMADIFFEQLDLKPDYFLSIDTSTPLKQLSDIMVKLPELIEKIGKPDLMIVPGDVNSTLGAALVANKLEITLAHLESGLRSFDRSMPEELNRLVTDELADHYFVTEKSGVENLQKESKLGKVHLVGNTMIDTLVYFDLKIEQSTILDKLKIRAQEFVLVTLHRPSNVDSKEGLVKMVDLFKYMTEKYNVVFPVHPRTLKNLELNQEIQELEKLKKLKLIEPLGYFDFQKLVKNTKFILTDSGGIQEESTYRRVPCLTLRNNTERPITIEKGTNTLVAFENDKIIEYIESIENHHYKKGEVPELWDGKTTERILKIINCLD